VFLRDTANGFLTWARRHGDRSGLPCLGGGLRGERDGDRGCRRRHGCEPGGAAPATQSGGTITDPTAYFVDSLYRTDRPGTNAADEDVRAQSTRILLNGSRNGDVPAADKSYLAMLVAARTGLSQDDAAKRVDEVIAQGKAAEAKARLAADTARKAGAYLSVFTALPMLDGAFIACVAAAVGGQQRDEY
jgi:hypothetical protein